MSDDCFALPFLSFWPESDLMPNPLSEIRSIAERSCPASSPTGAPSLACAELAGLAVLHYDRDFERIAELTRQPTQWIVPRGSVS